MSIRVTLKRSYEVPITGLVGAAAQLGFVSGKITVPFRINGVIIVFADDHIYNVLHYLLTSVNTTVSAAIISAGDNLIPITPPVTNFIGHSMIKHVKVIKEFPEGNLYLKLHIVNNNAYGIRANTYFIVEEL